MINKTQSYNYMVSGIRSLSRTKPLVGCITRLVPQKGVHLIRHAIYITLELGGQFVLLGSSLVPHIQFVLLLFSWSCSYRLQVIYFLISFP
ncbi:unnamed protein product [Brassica oleracea]|uniref:starch synthase n=2 Tax=Brassica TaxID=3705 RepID=A0A816KY51_BRANA|nr:unnamed protein product [Brassica napus]VDD43205.1 unnamed protein product [Brassica oleracea]